MYKIIWYDADYDLERASLHETLDGAISHIRWLHSQLESGYDYENIFVRREDKLYTDVEFLRRFYNNKLV